MQETQDDQMSSHADHEKVDLLRYTVGLMDELKDRIIATLDVYKLYKEIIANLGKDRKIHVFKQFRTS